MRDSTTSLGINKGKLKSGDKLRSLGYPDREVTTTEGIVTKSNLGDALKLATCDIEMIEHDATIRKGSSGGPALTENAQVAGVNVRGNNDTRQFYAVSSASIIPFLDQLLDGEDIDNIGLGFEMWFNNAGNPAGIYVPFVEPGSKLEEAGLKAKDLIVKAADIELDNEDSLSHFCRIAKAYLNGDAVRVTAYRIENNELLKGEGTIPNGKIVFKPIVEPTPTPVPTSTPVPPSTGLTIFNKSDETAFLALGYLDSSGEWVAKGWYSIEPGQSRLVIDEPLQPRAYYAYAESNSSQYVWRGDYLFWVHPSEAFGPIPYTLSETEAAQKGYEQVGFFEIDPQGEQSLFFTLNP